jgi:hypothetical protein
LNLEIYDSSTKLATLVLTDRGGFANLNLTYPRYNAQANPDGLCRAYQAVWLKNVYAIAYLNITDPKTKTFPLVASMPVFLYNSLTIDGAFAGYIGRFLLPVNNPFNVDSTNFCDVGKISQSSHVFY